MKAITNIAEVMETITNDLINFFAGGKLSDAYTDEQREIALEALEEWEKCPCDREGATPEQDKAMDEVLEKYSAEILASMNEVE